MIQLDNNFPEVPAAEGGTFEQPPAGGYVLRVLDVSDKASNAGNTMVTLSCDIAQGDHEGAFQRYPKKFFQLVNGDHLPYFKAMLNHFKESNPPEKLAGLVSQSLQFNPQKLKGTLVGACLRETEYVNKEGNVAVGLEIWYLCPVKDVDQIKVPALKKLAKGAQRPQAYGNNPPPPEDDLPF